MMRVVMRIGPAVALLMLWPVCGAAQQKEEEEIVVKVYRVTDLVMAAPNYAYEGTSLPQMREAQESQPLGGGTMGGMGGGMMGGMGGQGGGMGGGMFQVPDHLAQVGAGAAGGRASPQHQPTRTGTPRIDMDTLIEAITSTIDPSTWDEVGGEGSISPIGGALAIRQTPTIHAKVQEFLEALKREIGTLHMLTIDAKWLELDNGQLEKLRGSATSKRSGGGEAINADALAALPAESERYAGQITCFNGQTVHLVSGRIESVINGLIPVVGGGSVGYQPVMFAPHLGVLLQITPSALPEEDGVLVDLRSTVTRWDKSSKVAHIGTLPDSGTTVDVDRINVTAQQFATSLRMPLDQSVLVGGVTFPAAAEASPAPKADAGSGKRPAGLYLIVKVLAVRR
jgi:hypothetical protein